MKKLWNACKWYIFHDFRWAYRIWEGDEAFVCEFEHEHTARKHYNSYDDIYKTYNICVKIELLKDGTIIESRVLTN